MRVVAGEWPGCLLSLTWFLWVRTVAIDPSYATPYTRSIHKHNNHEISTARVAHLTDLLRQAEPIRASLPASFTLYFDIYIIQTECSAAAEHRPHAWHRQEDNSSNSSSDAHGVNDRASLNTHVTFEGCLGVDHYIFAP